MNLTFKFISESGRILVLNVFLVLFWLFWGGHAKNSTSIFWPGLARGRGRLPDLSETYFSLAFLLS